MKALFGLIVALASLASGHALAQSWPEQTVRILVGFPAGTAPDVAARVVADKFTARLGQAGRGGEPLGASGNIACDRVAKAAPDGYTLIMCGNSSLVVSAEPVRQAAL